MPVKGSMSSQTPVSAYADGANVTETANKAAASSGVRTVMELR
jgi:hypothetical protein